MVQRENAKYPIFLCDCEINNIVLFIFECLRNHVYHEELVFHVVK